MRILAWLLCWIWLYQNAALAQSLTTEQFMGTWIGESTEVDMGRVQPLPWRMSFQADSTVQLALMANGQPARTIRWKINAQAVQIDTVKFSPGQWVLSGNQLRINGFQTQRYRRLVNIPLDSASIRGTLVGRTWSTDSLSYRLFDDGTACLKNHKLGNTTLHYWHLVPVETSLFLIVKGTHKDPDAYTHYPLQITQLSATILGVRGWNGQRWGDFMLTRTANLKPDQYCQPEGFQLCNTFLIPSEQKYPYYEYKKGRLGAIRRLVARDFKPVLGVGQSGLVRFRFVVNCEGKAGMFEMLTLDENYERCQFDTRITDQLRRIVQEKITDWEPGKGTGTDTHNTYDTACLLTFRLQDGQVVEIFP